MRSSKALPPIAIFAAIVAASTRPAAAPPSPVAAPSATMSAAPVAAPAPTSAPDEAEVTRLDAEARAPASDVRLAPSANGALGAWLVAGPFRGNKLDAVPQGVDESAIAATSGEAIGAERDLGEPPPRAAPRKKSPPARWTIASSNEGALDLKAALDAAAPDLVAYAAGTLHVEKAGRYLLLLGVDDGVRVTIDKKTILARDDGRPVRDDDDILALDLAAGDHDVVLKFHQRDGAWAFHARFVDEHLAPPLGAYLRLPGTNADDAKALAGKMSWVSFERTFDGATEKYRPRLVVRYPEGAPRGVPLAIATKLSTTNETIFDLSAGGVPVTARGAGEAAIALPPFPSPSAIATLESNVAGRLVKHTLVPQRATEQALAHATKALAKDAPWLSEDSRVSITYLTKRLGNLLAKGDGDVEAQADEAHELERLAASLDKEVDPYVAKTGVMRRAIRSRLDGEPTEFGMYVPAWYKPGTKRQFPLIIGLHGLNGYSLGMMRWLFGGDDPKKEQSWEDRHVGTLPNVDAFIITPQAHGNTLYRELGEDDVMRLVEWAQKNFPIDPSRITITGPSMGGIGSASMPLHFPHVFAAAEPLCGYHSYLIRHDVAGHRQRPWETFLAEERSNVLWAENGEHLPLYIVHGTKDTPEENSGVLIDRYEKLNYSVKHEHPDAGHNVWQQTYEDLAGMNWLLKRRVDLHPAHVRFKTTRTRWSKSAWVTVDELAKEQGWADVDARVRGKTKVGFTSTGAAQVTFARDEKLLDPAAAIEITADGQALSFDAGEALVLHREGKTWKKGAAEHAGLWKHGTVTGPLRDVFYEPVLFVYAAGPEARANEEVARALAKIRYGVSINYPVTSDAEFLAKNEPLGNERALFLVGRDNKVTAALEKSAPFPIHVGDGFVTIGAQRITGKELGAAFIRPNPARPDRYVVVLAGADVAGTLRALSLPDLLPDFVVWDEKLAPARGQVLLGSGSVRAGGFFTNDWALPADIADPLAN